MTDDLCILLIMFISRLTFLDGWKAKLRLRNKMIRLVEKARQQNEKQSAFVDEILKVSAQTAIQNIELRREITELKKKK